jgi:1,4-alpha-glucan branching enzyme
MSLGGEGYLTFMGNEFGHPEWIDFPREGNGWSYHYCRRQWSLVDNTDLKYQYLNRFEKDMVSLAKRVRLFRKKDKQLLLNNWDKVVAYQKGPALMVFNFNGTESFSDYYIPTEETGKYQVVMSTDDYCYGGFGNIYHQTYEAIRQSDGRTGFTIYLPSRTAVILRKNEETECDTK